MAWHIRVLDFLRHLLRFGIAGTATAAVQGLTYVGFVDLGWCGPVLASVIAFAAGTVISFAVHFNWTFKSSRAASKAAWRFGVAKLAGLGVNTGGVWLVADALGLSHYWGLAVMLGVTPVTVFTISKFWAFRDVRRYETEPRES